MEFFENHTMFIIYTIVIVAFCFFIDNIYTKFRGYMGEFWVKRELNKLPKSKYIILNNIMLKDTNGTHQIDHIVLSKFGIFVIEMKNYYGLIRGKEFDNKWCQYLGKNKNYFFNPIYQNYGHIKSLLNLFELEDKCFISIVCFSNQAKIDIKSKNLVTQVDYLKDEILKYNEIVINSDIKELADIIIQNNVNDKKLRKQHIKDIHFKINNKKELEDNMICPRCGNKLIERSGKYGVFFGCSNYPKCKYIKKYR